MSAPTPHGLNFNPEPANETRYASQMPAAERGEVDAYYRSPPGEWDLPNNDVGQGIYRSPRETAENNHRHL